MDKSTCLEEETAVWANMTSIRQEKTGRAVSLNPGNFPGLNLNAPGAGEEHVAYPL